VFRFDPFAAQPVLGRNDTPEADPVAEAARQMKHARQAFANEEYGRVAEHLDRAIRVKPDDPVPYFLKAQARMAAGEYADAVESIHNGLERAPNWPASGFNPRDFYGPDADRFDAHLGDLRKAALGNPDEPALQFLLAYHLWFTGEREAALELLTKARKQVRDGHAIEAFLTEAAK
jgi:tetratricopeptide (TPR) repeat protein